MPGVLRKTGVATLLVLEPAFWVAAPRVASRIQIVVAAPRSDTPPVGAVRVRPMGEEPPWARKRK